MKSIYSTFISYSNVNSFFLILQESVKTFITAKKRKLFDNQGEQEETIPLVEQNDIC